MSTSTELHETANRFIELLSDRTAEMTARMDAADREASERVGRYSEAADELRRAERDLASLRGERERLPGEAYRAGLDEEFEREDDLKERYKETKKEIEAAEDRVGSLKGELREIVPRPRFPLGRDGSNLEATLHTSKPVGEAAREARDEIEGLRKRIEEALGDAREKTEGRYDKHRAWTSQMSVQLNWQEAEANRFGGTLKEQAEAHRAEDQAAVRPKAG